MSMSRLFSFRTIIAMAMMAAGTMAAPAMAAAPAILFIGRADVPKGSADPQAIEHLRSRGNLVTVVDRPEGYADALKDACRYDLVIISSTIRSRDFLPGFRDIRVPLLTWENDILDDLRFTGRYKDHDFGEVEKEHYLWVVNAPHPLAAGQPAGTGTLYDRDQPMGWGKPGLGAAIIATLPGQPDKAAIFGYERGATMDYDFLAPARRVFLPLNNDTFGQLNADGTALFDAATAWALQDGHRCKP
jgi:hypothetical protein